MPVSRAELADSAMGDDIEAFYPGIMSVPITVECRQDFTTAATGVDKLLWGLFNDRRPIRFKTRAVDAAVSGANPSYRLGKAYVTSVTPMSGPHGQLLINRFTIKAASGGAFTRSTST